MSRLVDYFVITGRDPDVNHFGVSNGVVLQRFPRIDHADIPFPPCLAPFCCSTGYAHESSIKPIKHFISTLTDENGVNMYAHCLQFYEKTTQVDQDNEIGLLYSPKIYVLLSRYPYFELFQNLLHRLCVFASKKDRKQENLIAQILAAPIPASANICSKFIVDGDHFQETLSYKAFESTTTPVTGCMVYELSKYLGNIHNFLLLFRALLSDQKILLHSSCPSRLSTAGIACKAVLYPMEYAYTYVSVLPEDMFECLESPTPFLMGILSDKLQHIPDIDAVLISLDTGEIQVPSTISMPVLPSEFEETLITSLQLVLDPKLHAPTYARETAEASKPLQKMLDQDVDALTYDTKDKLIRTAFLTFMKDVLHGYRWCLKLIRFYDQPLIVFHKSAYMALRQFASPLIDHVLDSHMFQIFIAKRALPYRATDTFDDFCAEDPRSELTIHDLWNMLQRWSNGLSNNENQYFLTPNPTVQIPTLVCVEAQSKIDIEAVEKRLAELEESSVSNARKPAQSQRVPKPNTYPGALNGKTNSRHLEVLEACLTATFDGSPTKIRDARKMMSAVELILRNVEARVYLCQRLNDLAVPVTRASLHPNQFDIVVRLLNSALERESAEDRHGIAYACLHLGNLYCRKLTQGVQQYAYTCLQDHSVWNNQRFWESAFFHDVHLQMRLLYGRERVQAYDREWNKEIIRRDVWCNPKFPTAMDVVEDHLVEKEKCQQQGISLDKADNPLFVPGSEEEEERIIYGLAKHYINLMVYMKVPLDPSRLRRVDKNDLEMRGNALGMRDRDIDVTNNSDWDTGSNYTADVGNEEDMGTIVVGWISKVVDRICGAANLNSRTIEQMKGGIPGFVAMHIDSLEQVYLESRKIASPAKVKLLTPALLTPCERVLVEGLRCMLLPESVPPALRTDSVNACQTQCDLTAEGAIFLTNYRVIFKGRTLDVSGRQDIVVRFFPVMSITKEKSVSYQQLVSSGVLGLVPPKTAAGLHDAVQIRSSCFQLLTVAFDEEVSSDKVEEFCKTLNALRWPATIPQTLFAYSLTNMELIAYDAKKTVRISTIRDLKRAVLSSKKGSGKDVFETHRRHLENGTVSPIKRGQSAKEITEGAVGAGDRRRYCKDYERLRVHSENSILRISHSNAYYDVVKSYPSCYVLPASVSDDILPKIAKGFKNGRFPVITWTNENGTLLIRGSGFMTGNLFSKIKKQANSLHPGDNTNIANSQLTISSHRGSENGTASVSVTHTSSEYQDQYFSRLAQVSPLSGSTTLNKGSDNALNNSETWDSLLSLEEQSLSSFQQGTPDLNRRSATADILKPNVFLRSSGGKGAKTLGTVPDKKSAVRHLQSVMNHLSRKNMYVLVEKGSSKIGRSDRDVEYIPVHYPSAGDIKLAFKKFQRVMQPGSAESDTFLSDLQGSGYLTCISDILSLAQSISAIITLNNSSVALCIEDGWDVTCAVSSLVQLLQDPFYRTFDGFRTLIEKEWLAFGHRFSHRMNHTISSQNSGVAPIFVLFLDCLSQIAKQFPAEFEFSDFYLRFLAYHSQSAFFRTFLMNSEFERADLDRKAPESVANEGHKGCIFTYIQLRLAQSPASIFRNEVFHSGRGFLYPAVGVASLEIWPFYQKDDFCHGSPYDIELALMELSEYIDECYASSDCVVSSIKSSENVNATKISQELSKEKSNQDKIDVQMAHPDVIEDGRESGVTSKSEINTDDDVVGSYIQRTMLWKQAMRILLKGPSSRSLHSQPNSHIFEPYAATGKQPHTCSVCKNVLYGTVVKTGKICKKCNMLAHDCCLVNAPKACGTPSVASRESDAFKTNESRTTITNNNNNALPNGRNATLTIGAGRPLPLHQGYLNKKGATFKLWSPRWFVLEANTHKLAYYETETDATCRGSYDLCDLLAVEVFLSGTRAVIVLKMRTTKKTSEKTVMLMADSISDAEQWKERIEQVLRE